MANELSISRKNFEEIKILRNAGKILAHILKCIRSSLKPGITTKQIEAYADKLMGQFEVTSAFKGYKGFPGSICVSVNEEIVHGIPGERVINSGDMVSIDCGIVHKGYYADSAFTSGVGRIAPDLQSLIRVANESLYRGIAKARVNNRLSDISFAIQQCVERQGFSVVREFVGHGIGKSLHEDPEVPNFGEPNQGPILEEGMVLCLEPMVNLGGWQTKIKEDGWTVVTADNKPSAHFEHMIAITRRGPEILTR
ncbi:MAG: type I methionyl aminopeptidase [Candidatus Omnitrophica bacterium]|nr:type I methionyl aminopeptidase [Candidatus Omnitrophota bacterium]